MKSTKRMLALLLAVLALGATVAVTGCTPKAEETPVAPEGDIAPPPTAPAGAPNAAAGPNQPPQAAPPGPPAR